MLISVTKGRHSNQVVRRLFCTGLYPLTGLFSEFITGLNFIEGQYMYVVKCLRFSLNHNLNPKTIFSQTFSCASLALGFWTAMHNECQGIGLKMLYINIHLLKGTKATEKKLYYSGKQQPAPRHPLARRLCPAALRMTLGLIGKKRALCLSVPLQ